LESFAVHNAGSEGRNQRSRLFDHHLEYASGQYSIGENHNVLGGSLDFIDCTAMTKRLAASMV
jgi:hypothetical protein